MRFTKFLATTMAVMAITSCSQQELVEGTAIEPGDAQIVLDLGRSFTTYASLTTENSILNGTAKLYDQSGNSIAWKSGGTIDNTGKLTGVVDAGTVNGLTNKNVKLLVAANSADKSVTAGTTGTNLEKEQAATSAFDLYKDQTLATGILSSGQFDLTLVGGPVTPPVTPTLKRTISRIYVKKAAGVTESIKDYNIQISGLSQAVQVYNYAGTGGTAGNITYKVTEAPEAGSYNNTEVVGYAYPTTAANISISYGTAGADMSNVKFEANKNYAIVVTPLVENGAVVDINITISSWDADTELDLTLTSKVKISDPAIPGVTVTGDNVTFPVAGLGTNSDYVKWTSLLNDPKFTLDEVTEVITRANSAMDQFYNESSNGALRWATSGADLLIAAMPNTTGKDITYRLSAKTTIDGKALVKNFNITVPAVTMPAYPTGFTTMFNGIEWMTLNTQNTGNGQDDINVFNKVNATAGATIIDKLKAYSASSEANHNEMSGDFSKYNNGVGQTKKAPTCPPGFVVPSDQTLRKGLMGVSSAWIGATEPLATVSRASFDTYAATISPSLTTNLTYYAHKANYKATGGDGKGYVVLKNSANEELMLPWRGNLSNTGENNYHISGLTSRIFITGTPISVRRFVFGFVNTTTGANFQLVDTSIQTYDVNSSLVRCVKITPETYWDIHK